MNKKEIVVLSSFLISALAYAYTTTTNMSLRIPATGDRDYPTSISDSFNLIDTHDHSPGKGVQIPGTALADNIITTAKILDANVTTDKIADNAVTTAKILDANVTNAKIAETTLTTNKLVDNIITTAKILDANVTTAKILDANVTSAKLATNLNLPGNTTQENAKNIVVSNTNAASSLSIIRATLNSSGALTVGEGIASVSHPSNGQYVYTWTTAFASTPVVVVSQDAASGFIMNTSSASTTGVSITSYNPANALFTDTGFSIIAIGPRN